MLLRLFFAGRLFLVSIFILAPALLAGCGSQQPSQELKVLRMGLVPTEDSPKMLESFKPMIAYLEKKKGIKIEPFVATDYSGVIKAFRPDITE